MITKQELALFDRYGRSGVEPFENWLTEDLAELETIVNAELQDRCRRAEPKESMSEFMDTNVWFEDIE